MPKIAEYISDCSKLGIGVLPPDINKSEMYFHVSENNIRFGLLAIKNVGQNFVANAIRERKRRPFSSFDDFIDRMSDYDMNKRQIESLIKSGAMDRLGKHRSQLLASYETIIDGSTSKRGNNIAGQLDFFSMAEGLDTGLAFKYPDLPEIALPIRLAQEKEATGLYFSGHPLDSYREHIENIVHEEIVALSEREHEDERKFINIVGMIGAVTVKVTRNGEKMAFFQLGDRYGEIECIAFARTYSQISYKIKEDSAVLVGGYVQIREDEDVKFIVSSVDLLQKNGEYQPRVDKKTENTSKHEEKKQTFGGEAQRVKKLYLRVPDLVCDKFVRAKNLVEIFEGTTEVVFFDSSNKQYHPSGLLFDMTEYTIKQLKLLLGDENVVGK
jgi:DNA polymerase-3 subunit alpha